MASSTNNVTADNLVKTNLFGTLDIDGVGSYYCFATQSRTISTWSITEKTVYDEDVETGKPRGTKDVIAIIQTTTTGRMTGFGKTYLISRLLDTISTMVGRASSERQTTASFYVTADFKDEKTGSFISYKASMNGRIYFQLSLVHEGFRLSLDKYNGNPPYKLPKLLPIQDKKFASAMVAGLGVRTFALLRRQMGNALDWYDKKDYRLIQTNEEFRAMMLSFLRDVQEAHNNKTAVLAALDTETTGLNMLELQPGNPARDHVVAIPFGWKNDTAFVICTDMYYFNNVDENEIYPLFSLLFSRNADYTSQHIELDYEGEHFSFERQNIRSVGANVGFDIRAFKCHDSDVFFDEDIQVMHYNLATDYVQGRNSLKWMTHHYIGDQTLELEDLFGPRHKDKYRYISDPELALVYGGADADYPRTLWLKLRRLTKDRLYQLYRKYDMTAVYRTALATWHGMPVNERAVKHEGELVLRDLETIKDFIYRYAYAANRGTLNDKSNSLCDMLGLSSPEDVAEIGDSQKMYRYKFTPANHKLLLFDVLGYPVVKISEKTQEPALDKYVLSKLAERKRETPVEFLKQSIMSSVDPSVPLIDKDEFNKAMFPLAQVFLAYSRINKEYTAYYKPIMTNDLESRMFYTFSLQRAATRRILSPGQTMKGSLKKLVIAPPGKLFMCFDASQIEYRHMASLAYIQTKFIMQQEYPDDWQKHLDESGIARIFRMMQNEEADYHIETASMMTGLPQYRIDHKTRKMYKSIGFGIPYGLGDRSMCESLFGKVTSENLVETRKVLDDYKNRQFEIIRLLESSRDTAFRPAQISDEFREMLGISDTHVGIVENFIGFYRLFILEDITRAKRGRIRRQAGNCIIQGGAAELFRRMIYNFYMGCVNAGLGDKVQWLMLVHDEVDTIFDADVDVCQLIDVVYKNCTLRYPDHIPYYVGIGFGRNWDEAKDDSAELPVIMVERLLDAYHAGKFNIPSDGNQPENLLRLKRHYMCDRIYEELKPIVPALGPGYTWSEADVELVNDKFLNYIVRAYLVTFLSKEDKKKYGKNVPLDVQLNSWLEAREQYGFGIDFLQETFVDANQEIRDMQIGELHLDGDSADVLSIETEADTDEFELTLDDMRIDLLENSDEEDAVQKDGGWTTSADLFDYSIPDDEILPDDSEEGYRYFYDYDKEEDNVVLNEHPTSAFDVYVLNKYVRQCIYNTSDGVYTAMLQNTPYAGKLPIVSRIIRDKFSAGSDTLILIGDEIRKVSGISCTAELLDSLDKLLTTKPA